MAKRRSKKKARRRISGNMFALAGRDPAYKRAKRAAEKAAARASKLWKKAQAKAKRKIRGTRSKRRR